MPSMVGIEPATLRSLARRSNQLRYVAACRIEAWRLNWQSVQRYHDFSFTLLCQNAYLPVSFMTFHFAFIPIFKSPFANVHYNQNKKYFRLLGRRKMRFIRTILYTLRQFMS